MTQHDLKQLFAHCLKEVGPVTGPDGNTTLSAAQALAQAQAQALAAAASAGQGANGGAADAAGPVLSKRSSLPSGALNLLGLANGSSSNSGAGGSGGGGEDDEGESHSKELSYRHFLELLAAVSHYVIRNPYVAVHDRVDKFILSVLASRKKLPAKVYRSAV